MSSLLGSSSRLNSSGSENPNLSPFPGERALNGAVEPQLIQVEGQYDMMHPFNVHLLWVNQFFVEGEGLDY